MHPIVSTERKRDRQTMERRRRNERDLCSVQLVCIFSILSGQFMIVMLSDTVEMFICHNIKIISWNWKQISTWRSSLLRVPCYSHLFGFSSMLSRCVHFSLSIMSAFAQQMFVCTPCVWVSAFVSKLERPSERERAPDRMRVFVCARVFGCRWNRVSCQIDSNHVARPMSISIIWVSVYVSAYCVRCHRVAWRAEIKQMPLFALQRTSQHIR